jgi:Holliday junction resolvase RusA-like endonuclease
LVPDGQRTGVGTDAGSVMVEITIIGEPYVKKSNQSVQWRGPRQVKVNTPAFNNWLREAYRQMAEQGYDPTHGRKNKLLRKRGQQTLPALIDYPINLQCKFYLPTARRVDLSALYEGIQDVLVECGVLEDDNWKIVASHDGSGVAKDQARPRIEVTITKKETTL